MSDEVQERIDSAVEKVCIRFNMFQPPCPTCNGTQKGEPGMNVDGGRTWAHCPDCVDGKVSIEDMAKLWERVALSADEYRTLRSGSYFGKSSLQERSGL